MLVSVEQVLCLWVCMRQAEMWWYPRLNCRLLFPLIDLYCCVMCRRGLCTGGCWVALRIKWAWVSGGGYYSGGVVLSLHNELLYASG